MRAVCLAAALVLGNAGLAQAQDVAAGEKVFGQCRACHQIGPMAKNSIGPVQNGLMGRKAGTYPGYVYSNANKNSDLIWDEATFRDYIRAPQARMPGTKMAYPGLKNEQQITDLVAFLKSYNEEGEKVAAN